MKCKAKVYLPNKSLKKVESNLETIIVEVTGGNKKNKSLEQALVQTMDMLNCQLITAFVNPYSLENLNKWFFKRLKHCISPTTELTLSVLVEEISFTKEYCIFPDLTIGLDDIETYTNTSKKIRCTTNESLYKAHEYLETTDVVRLVSILCPPYSKDWLVGNYIGFFNSIEINPRHKDSWNYDYKHFLKVFQQVGEKLSNRYNKNFEVTLYISDMFVNTDSFSKEDSANIDAFVKSCSDYVKFMNYNIQIKTLSSQAIFPTLLPKIAPSENSSSTFLHGAIGHYPELELLLDTGESELNSILTSDKSINTFTSKNKLGNDSSLVLKCASQIRKMKKVKVLSNTQALNKALQKYVAYKEFSKLLMHGGQPGLFTAIDTGFTYASNFFEQKSLPVVHVDPWKLPQEDYTYSASTPSISVVVPTHNDVLLPEFLASLQEIERLECYGKFKYIEVLIVSNGSDHLTFRQLQDFAQVHSYNEKLIIRHLHTETKGIAHARNFGVANAFSNNICFIDADCEIDQNYFYSLSEYLHLLSNGTIVRGNVSFTCVENKSFVATIKGIRTYYNKLDLHRLFTPNLVLSKDTFYSTDGFNTSLANGEDTEWDYRCKKIGLRTEYIDSLKVTHKDSNCIKKLTKNWAAYGYTRGFITKNHANSFNGGFYVAFIVLGHIRDILTFFLKGKLRTLSLLVFLDMFYFKYFIKVLITK